MLDCALIALFGMVMFCCGAWWMYERIYDKAHELGRKQGWLEGETHAHYLNAKKCFEDWEWTK